MTDWYTVMDKILFAQDAERWAIAEAASEELVEQITIQDIDGLLAEYPKWKYRYILAWVAGHKGEDALSTLYYLARDENLDVKEEAEKWISELVPPPPEPEQLKMF